jgi:hypothetical protein
MRTHMKRMSRLRPIGVTIGTLALAWLGTHRGLAWHVSPDAPAVRPLFDLSSPRHTPFPSDRFTAPDPAQNTRRRVALPEPTDCSSYVSECHDIGLLNRLDGFNLLPRVSIPFDGEIDVSVTGESVFFVPLGDALIQTASDEPSTDLSNPLSSASVGRRVGITQVVWDPRRRAYMPRLIIRSTNILATRWLSRGTFAIPLAEESSQMQHSGAIAMIWRGRSTLSCDGIGGH